MVKLAIIASAAAPESGRLVGRWATLMMILCLLLVVALTAMVATALARRRRARRRAAEHIEPSDTLLDAWTEAGRRAKPIPDDDWPEEEKA